jgi:glycerol-3-phosphate O-acyltransferase / dihydroxyacetone phosphate acyltransferase
VTSNASVVRRHLLEYYSLPQSSRLSNSVLSSLPLPNSLDPHTPATLPSRLFTLLILLRDSISAASRLPFFLLPLLIHLPVYLMSRLGASFVEDEEETQAQNKVAFGLLSSLLIYPATFFFLWALFYYNPVGAFIAAFTVYSFASYHNKTIDGKYIHAAQ